MKILITGGAGFIGSHIQDAYISARGGSAFGGKKSHKVIVVDNLSTGDKKNLNPRSKFYKVDVTSPKVKQIIKKEKPDIINHHAAQIDVRKSVADPVWDAEVNILGIINLLEAARDAKVKKFIFASSGGALYGDTKVIPTPEDHPEMPVSPYGIGKLTSEKYLHYYHLQYGLKYVALRYSNVYGPRQNSKGEAGVVAIFADRVLAEKQAVIYGNGKNTRDYVFINDVVEANVLALRAKTGAYNIATGVETNVNQIFVKIAKAANANVKPKHGPGKPGEQRRSCLDWKLARKVLGWEPRVGIDEGIRKTVEWFKNSNL